MKLWIVERHNIIRNSIENCRTDPNADWELFCVHMDEIERLDDPKKAGADVLFAEYPDDETRQTACLNLIQRMSRALPVILISDKANAQNAQLFIHAGVMAIIALPQDQATFYFMMQHLEIYLKQWKTSKREKRSILLDRFLRQPELTTSQELEELFFDAHADTCYQMAVIRLLPIYRPGQRRRLDLVQIKAVQMLEQYLDVDEIDYIMDYWDMDLHILLIGRRPDLVEMHRNLERFLEDLKLFSEGYIAFGCWAGLGNIVFRKGDIPQSFQMAESLIRERFFRPAFTLLTMREKRSGNPNLFTSAGLQALANYVEAMNGDAIEQLLTVIRQNSAGDDTVSGEALLRAYNSIGAVFSMEICKYDVPKIDMSCFDRFRMEYEYMWTIDNMHTGLMYIINDIFRSIRVYLRQVEPQPIQRAKQYIREFITMPLTLQEISSYVGYNPSYFSTYFKKETGQSLRQYITQTRVDYAKQLILEENLRIGDVAESVGFNDKKYFEKIFKKTTGMTPVEYRKRYRN